MYKIAVVGSREFIDMDFARDVIRKVLLNSIPESPTEKDPYLISGGAKGIDTLAENIAKTLRIKPIIFKPDWDDLSHSDAIIKTNKYDKKYDARAGMRRNKLIIDKADMVLAFWDGKSTGTKNSIDLAIKAGKPINIYVRN